MISTDRYEKLRSKLDTLKREFDDLNERVYKLVGSPPEKPKYLKQGQIYELKNSPGSLVVLSDVGFVLSAITLDGGTDLSIDNEVTPKWAGEHLTFLANSLKEYLESGGKL